MKSKQGNPSIAEVEKMVRDLNPPKPKSELFIKDPEQPRFGIRVLPSGVCSWAIRYYLRGKPKRKVIGDVKNWKRKPALEEARRQLREIDAGRDPQKAKRDAAEAANRTFEFVVAAFLEDKKEELRPASLTDYKNYLRDGYYFKPFHKRPFDEIEGPEFKARIKFIKEEAAKAPNARGGNDTAKACHAAVKYLYDWAALNDLFDENRRNPLWKVKAPAKNPSRERVLTPDEIRIVWKACDDWEAETLALGTSRAPGGFDLLTDYPRAVKLLLLTGMRSKEMGDLHWSEVTLPDHEGDIGQIELLKHRTKEKRPKCIPLSNMAVEILRKVEADAKAARPDDKCVFGRGDGRPIVLDGVQWKEGLYLGDSVRKLLKRLARGGTGFWEHVVDQIKERRIWYALDSRKHSINQIMRDEKVNYRTIKKIEKKYKDGPVEAKPAVVMDHWTIHDLRRTFRTGLSECRVPFEIKERLLGHLTPELRNQTAAAYDKHQYWEDKFGAVNKWEDRVKKILAGTEQAILRSKSSLRAA